MSTNRIALPATAFAEALGHVTAAVEKRNTNPLLACVRLAAESGELEIVGTDLDIEVTATVDAAGALAPVCIEAEKLAAALARLKGREAALEVAGDTATLVSGRSRFTLPTLDAKGWARFAEVGHAARLAIPGQAFARLFAALRPAISDEETRFYLNGVMLERGAVRDQQRTECLLAAATDGHKLYVRHIEIGAGDDWGRAIVPRKTGDLLAKLCAGEETVTVAIGDTKIAVTAGRTAIISKLIEGLFPDWRRVTPWGEPHLSYNTAQLSAAAETATAVVTASNAGKGGKGIKLRFEDEETTIEAKDLTVTQRTGLDACPHAILAAPPIEEIGVNGNYLVEMLDRLDAETVELAVADVGSPIVLTAAGHDDRRIVIMPVRV